jgi:T-complex protein 1 subunit epsilon
MNLSKHQDISSGDGTTSVVLLCAAMCSEAQKLISIHKVPVFDIIEGYKNALENAIMEMETLAFSMDSSYLSKSAETCLNSKMIGKKKHVAEICVNAVRSIADFERGDYDLNLIQLEISTNASETDGTKWIQGLILKEKTYSNDLMKNVQNAKICLISFSLEIPKPKTKFEINIHNKEEMKTLLQYQTDFYKSVQHHISESGCSVLICQWGIDSEINQWLLEQGITTIRWVPGNDLERVHLAVGGQICTQLKEIRSSNLGHCDRLYRLDQDIVIQSENAKTSCILIMGNNTSQCEESKRSIYDALCNVRNALLDKRMIVGGGSIESVLAYRVSKCDISKAWGDAIMTIPFHLAQNCGMNAIETIFELKKRCFNGQLHSGVHFDKKTGKSSIQDMKQYHVFESYGSKKSMLQLSTEMTCMILKIDEIL